MRGWGSKVKIPLVIYRTTLWSHSEVLYTKSVVGVLTFSETNNQDIHTHFTQQIARCAEKVNKFWTSLSSSPFPFFSQLLLPHFMYNRVQHYECLPGETVCTVIPIFKPFIVSHPFLWLLVFHPKLCCSEQLQTCLPSNMARQHNTN